MVTAITVVIETMAITKDTAVIIVATVAINATITNQKNIIETNTVATIITTTVTNKYIYINKQKGSKEPFFAPQKVLLLKNQVLIYRFMIFAS